MTSPCAHIGCISYVGDLSPEDADVLAKHGKAATDILEFGAGGSTQIFSQCFPRSLMSVETDPYWVASTRKLIATFSGLEADFRNYGDIPQGAVFDLIFVDGVDHLRKKFAIDAWERLKVGGHMLFHDTRRFADFQNVAWVAQLFFNEISNIEVNAKASNDVSSNITVITKKALEPYVNWNYPGKTQG